MRLPLIVAVALLALGTGAAVLVACSDGARSCSPGTLSLQVILDEGTAAADTITVTSGDPLATLTESTPRPPGSPSSQLVTVTFPSGYPTDNVVDFVVRASLNGATLGEGLVTVRLDAPCATGLVQIVGGTLDAFVPPGD